MCCRRMLSHKQYFNRGNNLLSTVHFESYVAYLATDLNQQVILV